MSLSWMEAMVEWGREERYESHIRFPRERKMQRSRRQLRLGNPNFGMERIRILQRTFIA